MEEDTDNTEDEEGQQQPKEEPLAVENHDHHLSYHALKGTSARGTIRFTGFINGTEIQVLLDGGSSDNFHYNKFVFWQALKMLPLIGNRYLKAKATFFSPC